jgi:hypothetical protein
MIQYQICIGGGFVVGDVTTYEFDAFPPFLLNGIGGLTSFLLGYGKCGFFFGIERSV